MRHSAWICLLLVMCGTCLVVSAIAQTSQRQDKTGITVVGDIPVRIDFAIRDRSQNNRVVDNLPLEGFRVEMRKERGRWEAVQPRSVFGGERPGLFVIAFDISPSNFERQEGAIKASLQSFVRNVIRPGKDSVLLLPFATAVSGSGNFTSNVPALIGGISLVYAGYLGKSTALFDALLIAANRLDAEETARGNQEFAKAIILLSDGQENASRVRDDLFGGDRAKAYLAKKEDTERTLFRSDVPVYTLYTSRADTALLVSDPKASPLPGFSKQIGTSRNWLEKLSENTGGRFFSFITSGEQQNAFNAMRDELTHRQSLVLIFHSEDVALNEVSREVKIEVTKTDEKGKVERDGRYRILAPPRFYLR